MRKKGINPYLRINLCLSYGNNFIPSNSVANKWINSRTKMLSKPLSLQSNHKKPDETVAMILIKRTHTGVDIWLVVILCKDTQSAPAAAGCCICYARKRWRLGVGLGFLSREREIQDLKFRIHFKLNFSLWPVSDLNV